MATSFLPFCLIFNMCGGKCIQQMWAQSAHCGPAAQEEVNRRLGAGYQDSGRAMHLS